MKSLLIRFFLSFWLIIGLTIGMAAAGGYWYAERVRDAYANFESGEAILEASRALNAGGREGLRDWLKEFPESQGLRVLILERNGKELLGRPVPWEMKRLLDRRRPLMPPANRFRHDPDNLMRARPLSQLIGPDGQRYIFVVVPFRTNILTRYGLPPPAQWLILALFVSASVSIMLAKTMSRPVQKLRAATHALADGDFEKRVSASVGKRRDELGLLARDFDQMADKLQRAARQQTELSRNISHELRSPLARLRVASELARREAGDLAELDRIDLETERLDSLVAQILNFTRLDSLTEKDKKTASLNDIIEDVVADVNFECKSSGLNGVAVIATFSSSITMLMHEETMRSAIENILRNAVKLSYKGGEVSLSVAREYPDKVIVIIDDRGPGLPERDLELVFEPFFRSRETAEKSTGTGLGLAIAARAIGWHGGSVVASNRAGGGLRITLEMPIQA
jgi:two-component system sensor histidine kinase CpxA